MTGIRTHPATREYRSGFEAAMYPLLNGARNREEALLLARQDPGETRENYPDQRETSCVNCGWLGLKDALVFHGCPNHRAIAAGPADEPVACCCRHPEFPGEHSPQGCSISTLASPERA